MGAEPNSEMEKRVIDIDFELRAIEEEEKMVAEGYAITFNKPATHESGGHRFTETIKLGALDRTDMKDVVLRYNHRDNYIIMARTRNKSLTLTIDNIGLKIRAELIDNQSNRDIYKAIQSKLIDKMSFAFRVSPKGSTWIFGENDTHRTITDIEKLMDVAVVDTPFYDTTSVTARSFDLLDGEKKRLDGLELEKEKLKFQIRSSLIC